MSYLTFGRRAVLGAVMAIAVSACAETPGAVLDGAQPNAQLATIYLVRHAEKRPEKPDPALSEAGEVRAALLADLLETAGIEYIHSTDTIRTRETARPLARRLGLAVDLYDAGDLAAFGNTVLGMGGVHLIVGHSNTTPDLVAKLGGDPGPPIEEADEYDRLYVLTYEGGEPRTELRRFGARYSPSE